MSDRHRSVGFSFGSFEMALITLVLVGLKFTVAPDLPWAAVLAPIWIPAALLLVLLGVPALVMILGLAVCAAAGAAVITWEYLRDLWKGGRE